MSDKYVFKEYSPIFPKLYQKEESRLSSFLTGDYQIEHMGSTAVPGLGGKGIIDIYVAVQKDKMAQASSQVQKAGYEFKPKASNPDRLFHQQDFPDELERTRRYHLHISYPESNDWINALAFRDYLRQHPEDLQKYAEIKKQAALYSDQDKDKYMAIKEPVIKEILVKALTEYNKQ